jgi:DNA-binding NarL/FixJ family response regulator
MAYRAVTLRNAARLFRCRFEAGSFDKIAEGLVLQITPWERAALQLLADETAPGASAAQLGTSETDLEARLTVLFARMGARNRSEAINAAVRRGLLRGSSAFPAGR